MQESPQPTAVTLRKNAVAQRQHLSGFVTQSCLQSLTKGAFGGYLSKGNGVIAPCGVIACIKNALKKHRHRR